MIPILYEANETAFISNGLGRLRDCTKAEVTEERNGVYELEFEVPVSGAHFDELICGRIVGVKHDDTDDIQPFEIYSYSKPIGGIVTFNAHHISYKQSKMTVTNGTAINNINDAFALLTGAKPSNPFSYWTDIVSTAYMSGAEGAPKTVRQLLGGVEGSILDAYGGEYEWDKWTVKLWRNRGVVRDYTIRYGVNLLDYKDDTDYSETYNCVIPYWAGQDDYGNDLIVKGSMITSGVTMYDGYDACVPLDLTDKFEGKPTVSDLEATARSYLNINQTALPKQTINVDFIRLQDTEEYAQYARLQSCSLCDAIRVVFSRYRSDGYYKIVKTVYDVLAERFTSMELGALSESLSSALGISSSTGGNSTRPIGIIDAGASGGFTWRKWADGTAECWGTFSGTVSSWSQWGGTYYSALIAKKTFPSNLFVDTPTCTATLQQSSGDAWLAVNGAVTKDETTAYYLMRGTSGGNTSYTIGIKAVGRWK